MNYIKVLGIVVFVMFSFTTLKLPAEQPVAPTNQKGAQMPPLTEEELKKLEQDMEAEINAFVESLPPEAQQQFYKDVEELAEVMSNMSEEELTSFIESMIPPEILQAEEPKPEQPQTEKIPETQPKPTTVEPQKIEPEIIPTKKQIISQETALEVITSIIKNIEQFLQKTQSIPMFAGKVEKWGTQRRIKGWESTLTWNKLSEAISKLKQQLYTLKEQDPKTKKYKYLPDLITNETLCNNLMQVKRILSEDVQLIEAPAFGLEKLKPTSKKALRNVLNSLTEAIYLLKLPTDLEKTITQYESKAQKIKAEEEAATKKAFEETKKTPTPAPTRIGGVTQKTGYYEPPQYYDKAIPRESSYYTPYTKPKLEPGRKAIEKEPIKKEIPKPKEPIKKEIPKPKEPIKKEAPKQPTISVPKQYEREIDRIKTGLEKVSLNLDNLSETVLKNTHIQQLERHLTDQTQTPDADLLVHITNITRDIRKACDRIGAITLNIQQLPQEQRAKYVKDVRKLIEKHKNPISVITAQTDTIIKNWFTLSSAISDQKKTDYKLPESIKELQLQLQKLTDAIDNLSRIKK